MAGGGHGAVADDNDSALADLLHMVAAAAGDAATVADGAQRCVAVLCTTSGWAAGHGYVVSPEGSARLVTAAATGDPARFEALRRAAADAGLEDDARLACRAVRARSPQSTDLADDDDAVAAAAVAAGLRAALVVPVLAGDEVVGLIELFAAEPLPAGPTLLAAGARLGAQLGRVAEREHLADALRRSESRVRLVIETASDAFVAMDHTGAITDWNAAAEAVFGWSRQEALGRRLADTIIPVRSRAAHDQGLAHYLASGSGPILGRRVELEALHRDGHEFPVELSVWPVRQGGGVSFNAFVHDISERRRGEAELRDAKERFQRAFHEAPIGMALGGRSGHLLETNRAYQDLLGYSSQQLVGMTLVDVTHPEDVEVSGELFRQATEGEVRAYRAEHRCVRSDGQAVWTLVSVSAFQDHCGNRSFVGQFLDITAQREVERRLSWEALHDPLTGLANRSLVLDRLRHALASSARDEVTTAVLFLDLDNFKAVNDRHGHAVGDQVLCAVADALRAAVRPSDTVGRFGGDEFVVVCERLDDEAEANEVAVRLRAAVAAAWRPEEGPAVDASVGVALARTGADPEVAVRDADVAMYAVKARRPRRA